MGEQKVSLLSDEKSMQGFVKKLLKDVQALNYMLENDWFEDDIIRIGAEQEMCVVDKKTMKPNCIAMDVLSKMKKHKWLLFWCEHARRSSFGEPSDGKTCSFVK